MHGDRVMAIIRTEKEREVAEPQELIEASLTRFIGRIKLIRDRMHVVPDHPQLKDAIRAKAAKGVNPETLKEGDWVVAKITRHPLVGDNKTFFCEVSEKITDSNDKIAPWWVTLAHHDLPNAEPAPQDSWNMIDEGLERQDLTELPLSPLMVIQLKTWMMRYIPSRKMMVASKLLSLLPIQRLISLLATKWMMKPVSVGLPFICRAVTFQCCLVN